MRQIIDFNRVPERQEEIHLRLERWGMWVKPSRQGWMVQPMFRGYRSHAWQWERPEPKPEISSLEALETEKIVSSMPEKYRNVIRWYYVFKDNPAKMARTLAVQMDTMAQMIIDGRDMAKNRLAKKATETIA